MTDVEIATDHRGPSASLGNSYAPDSEARGATVDTLPRKARLADSRIDGILCQRIIRGVYRPLRPSGNIQYPEPDDSCLNRTGSHPCYVGKSGHIAQYVADVSIVCAPSA